MQALWLTEVVFWEGHSPRHCPGLPAYMTPCPYTGPCTHGPLSCIFLIWILGTTPLRLQSQICHPAQPPCQSCGQRPHPPAQRALWSITLLCFSGCLAVERTWYPCLLTGGLPVPVWSICTRRTLHSAAPDVPQQLACCLVTKLCLTLRPHGLQHARLPCPSASPEVCSHSCPLSCYL